MPNPSTLARAEQESRIAQLERLIELEENEHERRNLLTELELLRWSVSREPIRGEHVNG